ncbi:hypothetical protein I3843_15G145000 [Carya illinoinensis]|nr:hypothetical protein I3843_15G145000 [Carya illinoinensis]
MVKGPNNYVKPRGEEEWAIDIKGPHYLEEINGIALYLLIFFKGAYPGMRHTTVDAKITSNSSNHVCLTEGVELVYKDWFGKGNRTRYAVWVGYSNLQSFKLLVLDNLQVQFDLHCKGEVRFYECYRAKVVYKNESRANRKRKMDEVTTKLWMGRRMNMRRLNQSKECIG